jgi:ribonuclease HI
MLLKPILSGRIGK